MKCVIKILISTSSVSWGEAKDHTGRTAWKTLATTLFLQHTTKVTCYITATPLNFSLFVPSVTDYPSLFGPDNGYLSYTEGNNTLNSSCQHTCFFGFLTIDSLPCRVTGAWNGTMLACESNVVGGSWKSHQELFEYLIQFCIDWHKDDITVRGDQIWCVVFCLFQRMNCLFWPLLGVEPSPLSAALLSAVWNTEKVSVSQYLCTGHAVLPLQWSVTFSHRKETCTDKVSVEISWNTAPPMHPH